MGIAILNTASGSTGANPTTLPLGFTAAGSLVLVCDRRNGGHLSGLPAGSWTTIRNDHARCGAQDPNMVAIAKAAAGETQLVITWDQGANNAKWVVYDLAGVDLAKISVAVWNDANVFVRGADYGPGIVVPVTPGLSAFQFAGWDVRDDTNLGAGEGAQNLTAGWTADYNDTIAGQYPKSMYAHRIVAGNQTPIINYYRGDTGNQVPAQALGFSIMATASPAFVGEPGGGIW